MTRTASHTRLDQDVKIKPHRRPPADIVGKTLIKEIFLLPWLNDAGQGLQTQTGIAI